MMGKIGQALQSDPMTLKFMENYATKYCLFSKKLCTLYCKTICLLGAIQKNWYMYLHDSPLCENGKLIIKSKMINAVSVVININWQSTEHD